jgi:periplasmic glucans biosynthesis protein
MLCRRTRRRPVIGCKEAANKVTTGVNTLRVRLIENPEFGRALAAPSRGCEQQREMGLKQFITSRRPPLYRLAACLLLVLPLTAKAFGFDDVATKARELAATAYRVPAAALAPELRDLDYDAHRDIRFRPERALWRAEKLPFELMFFHLGRNFQDPVRINTIEANVSKRVEFDSAMFDYGSNKFDPAKLRNLGFAGFRVHFPINKPGYKDEVLVFLGASYLRAVGRGQHYGLSARGLAVDTAESSGEEFPRFTEFWIERPQPNATSLTIHALLDSPRMTGAYRFVVTPGADTVMQVNARVYPREANAKIGIAPLNSMYTFGENQPGHDDYRPEVHDSDGLSIATANGEWIWRPLQNPKRLLVTSFATTDPKGFGLMQRDRASTSYEDPEALYERRPSAWVEPIGNWGAGRVELVQIPTPDETNDNIVAYWVPDQAPAVRQPFDFSYRLRWQAAGQTPAGKGWVVQTRRGRGYVKQADGDINFVVDFDGPALRALKPEAALDAVVEVGANGQLKEQNLFRNQVSGAWRMTVRIKRADAWRPVELRAHVKQGASGPLTETWSYIVPPEADKP